MTRTAVTLPIVRGAAVDRSRARRAAPGRYEALRDARVPAEGLAEVPLSQLPLASDRSQARLHARLAEIDRTKTDALGTVRLKLQQEALDIERGLAKAGSQRSGSIVTGAVVDPYEDGRARMQAAINRRVDILEDELAHRHLSQAAYLKGREIQALLEAIGRQPSASWDGGSRGDPVEGREARHKAIIRSIDSVKELETAIVARIGMIDWRLLRAILGDRMSFSDCAAARGRAGDRGMRYIATRFRDALEDLAEATAAKGKVVPPPDDDARRAALAAPARQAAALRGGATRRRLEGELGAASAAATSAPTLRERREAAGAAGEIGLQLADLKLKTAVQRAAEVGAKA